MAFNSASRAGPGIDLVLRNIAIRNATVRLVRPEHPIWMLSVATSTERADDRDMLVLDGHATLNNYPWQIKGHIATLAGLMTAESIELDIKLMLDKRTFSAQGLIGNTALFESVDMQFVVTGDDASVFGSLLSDQEAFIGDVLAVMEKGEIDNRAMNILGRGFLETAFEPLNPFAQTQRYAQINCAVLNSRIREGVLLLQPPPADYRSWHKAFGTACRLIRIPVRHLCGPRTS